MQGRIWDLFYLALLLIPHDCTPVPYLAPVRKGRMGKALWYSLSHCRLAKAQEGKMSRSLKIIAAGALILFFCVSGRGQDSPSLGDLARQAQKNKDKTDKPAARVITNDDLPSRSSGGSSSRGSSAPGAESGRVAQPGAAGAPDTISTPAEGLEKIQSTLDEVDSLDRATLASTVLDGNNSNFPGRAKWEEQLFAAKQAFVSQGRALLQKARQLEASAEGMKDIQDPNDPRLKSFSGKLEQLVQENQQNSAAFQAVVAQGKELSTQPVAH
jgi:hypothetical protein